MWPLWRRSLMLNCHCKYTTSHDYTGRQTTGDCNPIIMIHSCVVLEVNLDSLQSSWTHILTLVKTGSLLISFSYIHTLSVFLTFSGEERGLAGCLSKYQLTLWDTLMFFIYRVFCSAVVCVCMCSCGWVGVVDEPVVFLLACCEPFLWTASKVKVSLSPFLSPLSICLLVTLCSYLISL